MPAASWVTNAVDVPPLLTPAAVLNPGTTVAQVLKRIAAGHTTELITYFNEDALQVEAVGRYGGGIWGLVAGTGVFSGAASPASYTEIAVMVDALRRIVAGTIALTDNSYHWAYVTQAGALALASQVAATPPPALPNPSVFLGRLRMVGGVFTEYDKSGVVEIRSGLPYRRTADAGAPGDTPPSWAAFFHQTAAGLWFWNGSVYQPLSVSAAHGSIAYLDAAPRWYKFTKTFADLAAAALTNDIELFSLPAGGVVHAVKAKHSAAFTGGAIASYTLSVGIAANLVKYSAAFDVFSAPGNTNQQLTGTLGTENHGAATSIRLAAVATGANLNQATAGSADIYALLSKAL